MLYFHLNVVGRAWWHHSWALWWNLASRSAWHWHSHWTRIIHLGHSRSLHHSLLAHLWWHWHSASIRASLHRSMSHSHSWIIHSHWARWPGPYSTNHRSHWDIGIHGHIWRAIWRLLLHSWLHPSIHGHSLSIIRIHITWWAHWIISSSSRHAVGMHVWNHMVGRHCALRHLTLSHRIWWHYSLGQGICWYLALLN